MLLQKNWFWILLLCVFAVILYGKGVFNEDVFYPDADRVAVDGTYFYSFLTDWPISHIYDYTIRYYLRYPALSIGYREPLLPFIVGIFYHIMGIKMSTAILVVMLFFFMAITYFYKLIEYLYDRKTAFISSVLFITYPFVATWLKVPMLEIPSLALSLAAVYYFYRFSENFDKAPMVGFIISVVLAIWMKRTNVFLFMFCILYAVLTKKWKTMLRSSSLLLGGMLCFFALLPLAVITLWIGGTNLEAAVAGSSALSDDFKPMFSLLSIENLALYVKTIPVPVLLLSIFGGIFIWLKDNKKSILFLSWIAAVYITFTYIRMKCDRFVIYWIPAFCALSCAPLYYIRGKKKAVVYYFIVSALIFLQLKETRQISSIYNVSGYREAAQYITEHPKGYTVFFEGYGNGIFIFWVRALAHDKQFIVLRGDKILYSSSIVDTHMYETHLKSADEIYKAFQSYGTSYVVVESNNTAGLKIVDMLLELIKDKRKFKLVKEIKISTSMARLRNQSLLVYERLEKPSLTQKELVLRVPTAGRTIKMPVSELIK